MNKLYAIFTGVLLSLCITGEVFAQQVLINDAKKKQLADLSAQLRSRHIANRQRALELAKIHGWPILKKTKNGGVISLQGVNSLGFPIYYATDNTESAATTGTNAVQPGGSQQLNLSGSSPNLTDKLAEWDGGLVYTGHQEFAGKTITDHDNAPVADHATHVAGTMIATGVYSPAKGMAFNASTLHSYYFDNDVVEMSEAAPGLLLSNHSYVVLAGWEFDDVLNHWDWYGRPGDVVDYDFGFYGTLTAEYDNIAYSAPDYLIVQAAGNDHGSPGPAVGDDYWGYKSITDPTLVDKGPRPANISSNGGYDVISVTANAKNILTVGAINPLPNGPTSSHDISVAYFSSWGPTDDGRVKPDIVGDGVNVLSLGAGSPSTYLTLSGTSMATPNVTGSLYLLQEYYAKVNGGAFMRSATLKGLACATAFDAGNPGPDYIYGWGLLDMKAATQTITDNGGATIISEKTLHEGQQQAINVIASGKVPLIATICWTDPPGTPTGDGVINSRTPKLVNDLDIHVSDGTNTFYPWILDPNNPSAAAQKGDNIVDNVEQVLIPNAVFNKSYTITVTHKGTLQSDVQDYSLIVTGLGAATYCTSGPLSNVDSRINNVTLSNLNNTPAAGCTTYSDYTNLPAVQLQQGKSYPFSITLGTCGANFNKIAKVYIDWNGNGVFDPDELVATSDIINGTNNYTTNITVPGTVTPGTESLMRVVLTETSDPSVIQPCGTYAKGETQDYKVQFTPGPIANLLAGTVTGTISACAGTSSVSPFVQQFTVSGNALTGNITATAPANFEVSLTSSGEFGNSVTITESGGSVGSTTIYVRSAAIAPYGRIGGDVTLSTPGNSFGVTVSGDIDTWATIDPVRNQGPYPTGSTTSPIYFSGTGHAYTWTNDTPGIGLAASGTGDIPAFTVTNTTKTAITATVTVTPAPSPGFAYVPVAGENAVSVINTDNNTVVTKIPVGPSPEAVCVSPNGSRVYIANSQSTSFSVIDATNNTVIATVPTGVSPVGMATSPDGSKLYVCNDSQVSVFNTANNTLITNIPLHAYPIYIAISPDGTRAYVTNNYDNGVYVVNTIGNAVITFIKAGDVTYGVVVSPDGSRVYAANAYSNDISVISTVTNTIIGTIKVGIGAYGLTLNSDGSRLYVTNSGVNETGVLAPGSVTVINTADNSTIATIPTGGLTYPLGLSLTADDSKLYVANDYIAGNEGTVTVINTATNTVTTAIPLGVNPISVGNFISRGTQCTGSPIKFTITVLPPPAIANGPVTGTISACLGSPSASPDIQQFTVSGTNLTQDVTAAAPQGFEISLAPASGYTGNLVLRQSEGNVNTTVYVRSSAAASAGPITGQVALVGGVNIFQYVTVTGQVGTPQNPSVSITASATSICTGTPVTFTATPVNGGSTPVYQWLLNGSPVGTNSAAFTTSTLNNGDVIACGITCNAACVTQPNAASNTITMIVSSAQALSVSIAPSANNICTGLPITFTATTANGSGQVNYQWTVNGNHTGTNSAQFTSSTLVNGDVVNCIATSGNGCSAPADGNGIIMNLYQTPSVNAGGNKGISPGSSVVLNATATGAISDITWTPATGLSNNKILNPIASPSATTTYTLTVQTADGCSATASTTVTLLFQLVVPNTFTPNGDGVNDTWDVQHIDLYPNSTIQVFNRWGQSVYSSTGYGIPWDGTYKGSVLPAGTYYYVIDLKNGGKPMSGFVALLK